jgi:hypothetical protein
MRARSRLRVLVWVVAVTAAAGANAQFLDTFDDRELSIDPSGVEGWSFFTGDGKATMDFRATGEGHAAIVVDATKDERNIWWALIKHKVSGDMDLELLGRPGWELRVEARIRTSHAPRRVNLHLNTQRTTDFHSHLIEFDIPDAESWHTISMTTHDFPVESGDTIFAQMALMDPAIHSLWKDAETYRHRFVGIAVTARYVPTNRPAGESSTVTSACRKIPRSSEAIRTSPTRSPSWPPILPSSSPAPSFRCVAAM